MSDEQTAKAQADRITVVAEDFGPVALEYHRRAMGEKGYRLEGPILATSFQIVGDTGETKPLFDGKPMYAATFVKLT